MINIFLIAVLALTSVAAGAGELDDCHTNKKFEEFAFDIVATIPLGMVYRPANEKQLTGSFGAPRQRSISFSPVGEYDAWDITLTYSWGEVVLSSSNKDQPCIKCVVTSVVVNDPGIELVGGVRVGMNYQNIHRSLGSPNPDATNAAAPSFTVCQSIEANGVVYGGYATVVMTVDARGNVSRISWAFYPA